MPFIAALPRCPLQAEHPRASQLQPAAAHGGQATIGGPVSPVSRPLPGPALRDTVSSAGGFSNMKDEGGGAGGGAAAAAAAGAALAAPAKRSPPAGSGGHGSKRGRDWPSESCEQALHPRENCTSSEPIASAKYADVVSEFSLDFRPCREAYKDMKDTMFECPLPSCTQTITHRPSPSLGLPRLPSCPHRPRSPVWGHRTCRSSRRRRMGARRGP